MNRSLFQLFTIAWLTIINVRHANGFQVVWNVPSELCKRGTKAIKPWSQEELPETYGIRANEGHKFYGDVIVTLYEKQLGLYPYYKNYSDMTSAVHGGIPQRVNLEAHLAKVKTDIEKAIPNTKFSGLAIIDYEEWRPLWDHNWATKRIYRTASLQHVEERYGKLTKAEKEKIAIKEFDEASIKFLTATIRQVKELRPYAQVGYYGMPFCDYSAGKTGTVGCGKVFERFNDRLQRLYAQSTALYPSIYLPKGTTGSAGCLYVASVLQEAKRCAKKIEQEVPIFTFTGVEHFPLRDDDPFYTEEDLTNTLVKAFNMSVDGAIIWSTSKNMKDRCPGIGKYTKDNLGPKVQKLLKIAEVCESRKSMPYAPLQPYCRKRGDPTTVTECSRI